MTDVVAAPAPRPQPVTWPTRRLRRYVVTTKGTAHLLEAADLTVCGADASDWAETLPAAAEHLPLCHDCRALLARVSEARLARLARPCRQCARDGRRTGEGHIRANRAKGGRSSCADAAVLEDLVGAAYNRFLRFATLRTFAAQRRLQAALCSHVGRDLPALNDYEVEALITLDPAFAARVAAAAAWRAA